MNCWGFRSVIFDELEHALSAFLKAHGSNKNVELYLPTVVAELISKGAARVHVLSTSARWFAVTFREDASNVRDAVAALTATGVYPSPVRGV